MTIILEAEMIAYNILAKVDNDYYWLVTRAVSPGKAKATAQFLLAKKLITDVEYQGSNISKLKTEHDFKLFVDDEIDPKLWSKSKAVRPGNRPTLPAKEKLIDKVDAFMHRFYGYDTLPYPLDAAKLHANAKTYGFTDVEIKNFAFKAAVDAYIYAHLK